jgi:hypothetical protein
MDNHPDDQLAIHTSHSSADSQDEVFLLFTQLPKERRRKVAIEVMSLLQFTERNEVAQQMGLLAPNQATLDFIMKLIVITFVVIIVASFLAFVAFVYLGIKADLLFTLISTAAGFLVPSPNLPRTNTR